MNRRDSRAAYGSPVVAQALVDFAQPVPVKRRPLPPRRSWYEQAQVRCNRPGEPRLMPGTRG
jgi:hypothetical protein